MIRIIRGFSLVEIVISIVIISVACTGTLLGIYSIVRKSADPMLMQQSLAIAESYLEEILSKSFPVSFPCGAPPAGGRAYYESVCDYQGLINSGAVDQNGTAITGLSNYTVSVTIDGTTASLGGLTPGTQVVRIDVIVQNPNLPTGITFSAYKANY